MFTALNWQATVVTVVRADNLHLLPGVTEKVRLVEACVGSGALQWLISIDDLSVQPQTVLASLRGLPVRHEVWVNCSGQRGDDAAVDAIVGYADSDLIAVLLTGDSDNSDDIADEILAANYDGPEFPPSRFVPVGV